MRALSTTVALVAACAAVSGVAAVEKKEKFSPLKHFDELEKGSERRAMLDNFAVWMRNRTQQPVGGPSEESEAKEDGTAKYPLIVSCSEPEEECRAGIAGLNSRAGENAVLFEITRGTTLGDPGSAPEELREMIHGWHEELEEAGTKRESGFRERLNSGFGSVFTVVLILAHQKFVAGAASVWAPLISLLPSEKAIREQSTIFLSDVEVSTCAMADVAQLTRGMKREAQEMKEMMDSFCQYVNLFSIRMSDERDIEIHEVKIEEGTGCYFTQEQMNWAYATTIGYLNVPSNRLPPGIAPFINLMAYSPRPSTRVGQLIWANKKGKRDNKIGELKKKKPTKEDYTVGYEVIATRSLDADETLTFRSRQLDPHQVVAFNGYHHDDHFLEGMNMLIGWDDKDTERMKNMSCFSDPDANRADAEGRIHNKMLDCAQVQVTRGDDNEDTESARNGLELGKIPKVVLGAHDYLIKMAELADEAIPTPEKAAACFGEYNRPLLANLIKHNQAVVDLFHKFGDKMRARREQVAQIQEAMEKAQEGQKAKEEAAEGDAGATTGDL